MKSIELKETWERKIQDMDAMLAKLETEGREFTSEEQTRYEALSTEVNDIEKRIDTAVEREAIQRKAAEAKQPQTRAKQPKKSEEERIGERFSFMNVIRSQMPTNSPLYRELTGVEKEMHDEAENEMKKDGRGLQGVGIPSFMIRRADLQSRALSAGTTTEGGHTVETTVGRLVPFLEPRLVVESLGTQILTGLSGNLSLPVNDAQGSGAWEGEGDTGVDVSPTFASISLSPKRFGGYTIINKQLLAQSSLGVEMFVRNNLGSLIGQAIDRVAINGGGAGEPSGVLQASIGSVTAGALTWAKVIELETDVATANADMGNLAYLTTPGVRGVAKTTVKETGQAQYLWADNMMNGYPCAVSTLVPATLGGGAEHGLIFGNWRDLVIGQWGGIDIVVDPYSLATKAQIQIVANIWVDVAVLHAASFSAMEGVTV